MPKIRDQVRASAAFKAVELQIKTSPETKEEYRQELQQLPSRILVSGLGQTLAFYASKGGVHKSIGNQLAHFLSDGKYTDTILFLNQIMGMKASDYRQATRQALAYGEWLKRYSKALIE